jgi:hypothetical protein
MLTVFIALILLHCTSLSIPAYQTDLIYLSSPRPGGDTKPSKIPDAAGPLKIEPSTDLMVLPRDTTTPVTLVPGGKGAILDPHVSYDGTEVYYVRIPDLTPTGLLAGTQLPLGGCQIEVMNVKTRVVRVVVSPDVWHPSTGATTWSSDQMTAAPSGTTYLGVKRCHMSPVPLPTGDLFFVSNLGSLDIIRGYTELSLQGYIWYKDTNTIEQVWFPPTTILHPIVLSVTGEICFSTLENEQFGKPHRWGVWCMLPHGGEWRPLYSATMEGPHTRHFITEYQQWLYSITYYIDNNAGSGALIRRPLFYSSTFSLPEFGSPSFRLNPRIAMGKQMHQWAYTPVGTENVTPMMHTFDRSSDKDCAGEYCGKVGFPSASVDGILVSWSTGPVNHAMRPVNTPMPQLGIYLMPDGQLDDIKDLVKIVDAPDKNEWMAKPVVPYKAIYNMPAPTVQPTRTANNGKVAPYLPIGTSKAAIGSSSVWRRESCGGQWSAKWECSKPIFSLNDHGDSNRKWQGSDTHKYANADIQAIEVVLQEGVSHFNRGAGASGKQHSRSFIALGENQRYKVLGQIPLYKHDLQGELVHDKEGNPDTSFLALIPCNRSFGFRLVDSDGMALTQPATWHQEVCGAVDTRCTGCHTHNKQPLHFKDVVAGQPGFQPVDLTANTLWSVEYKRDIAALIERECVECHSSAKKAGHLDLENDTVDVTSGLPLKLLALMNDPNGKYAGAPGAASQRGYIGTVSRYINPFSAAESLFAWVVRSRRLDKVANDYRPSIEQAAKPLEADIDYADSVDAAHGDVHLTDAEQLAIIKWIDLGMPYDIDPQRGWFADEAKPILTHGITSEEAVIGFADPESGINLATLIVKLQGKQVAVKAIDASRVKLPRWWRGKIEVSVKDNAGNIQHHAFILGK